MLMLPVRSTQCPRVQHNEASAASFTSPHQSPQSPQLSPASSIRRREEDTMMATMPTTTPPTPKRPKLALQTSNVSSLPAGPKSRSALNLTLVTQTPTSGNTYQNAFLDTTISAPTTPNDDKSSCSSSSDEHSSPESSNSSATTFTSCHTSPFPSSTPYCLPLGPRSILRNSPIPRRLLSATATRAPKILFPRTKRVCFRNELEEHIPTSLLDETSVASDSDTTEKRLEDDIAERKALDDLLEGEVATANARGRRKRRRDWIWRPLDEDILTSPHSDAPAAEAVRASCSMHDRPIPELKRELCVSDIPHSDIPQSPSGSLRETTTCDPLQEDLHLSTEMAPITTTSDTMMSDPATSDTTTSDITSSNTPIPNNVDYPIAAST